MQKNAVSKSKEKEEWVMDRVDHHRTRFPSHVFVKQQKVK